VYRLLEVHLAALKAADFAGAHTRVEGQPHDLSEHRIGAPVTGATGDDARCDRCQAVVAEFGFEVDARRFLPACGGWPLRGAPALRSRAAGPVWSARADPALLEDPR